MAAPKKYVKVNGIMKLNPEYKRWREQQGGGAPATTVARPSMALPIVSSMEDHEKLNDAMVAQGQPEIPLAESTSATIEMMQEPEISVDAGMTPDTMVDELGALLNKYEVPIGLMNKLMMLSEYQVLEFMIDDSGSMTLNSDTIDTQGRPQTRWLEAQVRLKELIEILAYVPFNQIVVVFLNRPEVVALQRDGRDPKTFLADAYRQIDAAFSRPPQGTTPAMEKIQKSLLGNPGMNIARWFFGDGVPNGGVAAQREITRLLVQRENPAGNPVTFLSCTNEDDQVEWMKDAEEIAPYCSEADDFKDEAEEVLRDQGAALPYSKGFYLVSTLVGAMNPDDLDAMDESIPFTKATLDNLLGIQHNEESYRHYFNLFMEAQNNRKIEGPADNLKKNARWNYQDFLQAPVASQIAAVQDFKAKLKQMGVSHCWVMVAPAATTSRMMGHRHEARLTTKLAAGVEDPTSRRKFLDTVVIAAGLATTVSAAVSAPANAFDRKEDKFSYTINIPTTMKQSQKPVKTHQDEINFASEDIKGYQYGITVDPVRINSLKEFGTPEQVAARVVTAEVNRDGVFEVTLVKDPSESTDGAYILEYLSVGKRGNKHVLNKIFIQNNELYVLTAQCKEDTYDAKQQAEMKATVASFQV